ncbi:SHOCT domain-containing protein [Streptomyces sp. HPF1205]|uniref:SHOCT domain-containing protein n=1 Tax=Streptomyces sp. HPF1205 TaxID=2873262 RepID=UPI001CECC148|nr:SHOCT domain-containing protein [Streptomyces sp. HPF1205]
MSTPVPLAYSYPVLGAFWTVMWVFLWVLWLFLLFRVIADLFRDDTLGGGAKTGWLLFVILLPFLGVFVYLVVRGKDMGARETRHAREQREEFDAYVRRTAAGGPEERSHVDELARLSEIHDRGALSDSEFERAKEKILH